MRKPWIAVLCLTLVVAVLPFASFLFVSGKTVDSNILDFHPTSFAARADAKFFYSIADELKFGDEITVLSPTLMRGRITNFLVARDTTTIAVVANGVLLIADGEDQSVTKMTEVDSIYKKPKTGQYETLPKYLRVYQTLNSDQLTTYRISSGGILAR